MLTQALDRHYIFAGRKAFSLVQKENIEAFKGFLEEENWLFHRKVLPLPIRMKFPLLQ